MQQSQSTSRVVGAKVVMTSTVMALSSDSVICWHQEAKALDGKRQHEVLALALSGVDLMQCWR